ncbi:peptidase M4 thermolysin [Haliangium ochraceum DSM 14365]|uniref:Peptidase M4 thermolysin n=2 Tax=Haliangium ochraceum TaxID=80816 RepID=D0LNV7_HALO1|nr:peptidase M4 thermolysin [Haliangium ochraceum DSM 14365]
MENNTAIKCIFHFVLPGERYLMNRRVLYVAAFLGLPLAACNSSEFDSSAQPQFDKVASTAVAGDSELTRINLRDQPALWANVAQQGLSNRAFGQSSEVGFQTLRELTEPSGMVHTRTQQTYRGIPVWGEQLITSRDASGQLVRMHGNLIQGMGKIDTVPTLTAMDALAQMKSQHELSIASSARVYENESSELVIYADKDAARLAYDVSFFSDSRKGGEPTRPTFLVDAKTGEVLFQYEGLTTNLIGTGPGGNTKTGQYEYGTDFGFNDVAVSGSTCTMNTSNVKTVNLNHGTSGSSAYSYSCPRNTVKSINGAYSPLNDAHFFGGVVFNMYNDWVGTAPLSFQLTMRVHYSNNYQNAFWNGSAMTFGDGGSTFFPLVSLDVSSHEVSHGFTEQNSGLIYSGQSGGINEAFSDIAGEAAENYMHGSNDFLVGADIFKATGALRYMADPPQDGSSIGHADDYTSGMDVHHSSGVFNKAFYLLATTNGWTVQQAFLVFARANQNYWGPSTNYIAGAQGVVDAADDLGLNLDDVNAAFAAVGIGSTTPPDPDPTCDAEIGCVTLSLLTDRYGSETSWTITNAAGATVASGSGYANNTQYTETAELAPGDYIFTIRDSYGDGICCSYGNGSYALSLDGTTVVSGGDFDSSEATAFSVGGGTPPPATQTANLSLLTDRYGSETSWTITDSSGGTVASGSGYANNTQYNETAELDPGSYTFTIRDSYGDGICCAYGNGSYTLSLEGTTIKTGGNFGSAETTTFAVD